MTTEKEEWIRRVAYATPEGQDLAKNFALPLDQTEIIPNLANVILSDKGYTFRHLASQKYQWPWASYDSRAYLLQKFLRQKDVQIASGEVRVHANEVWEAAQRLRDAIIAIVCITTLNPVEIVNEEAKRLYNNETEKWLRELRL